MQDEILPTALADQSKKYICDLCGLILFSRSGIRRHLLYKHMGLKSAAQLKTELCTICGGYTTKRNFRDHVDSHSTARNFKCDICGSAVKSIYTLRKHMKRVHMKVKPSSSSLTSDMIFICEICDRKFPTGDGLRRHDLQYHRDGWSIICDVCGKKSLTVSENNYHMKIHSLERKFKCEVCHLGFARYEALKNHLIKHKGEWSYKCGLCSKTFKHSSSVSGHRRLHKINGFYHCGCCDDRFRDYGKLKAHFDNTQHSFCSQV